ncbi:ATPase, T2SS/T4P/T4SS family [Nocardioides sp. TF02-7]|uniref:CpaF family protein n=1 Tax=Nocardioides sp. TF02-7 TaxID=2917724 RepID=UPI001F06988B|nr:ATPase, T2SS/T4P/T4SS family [Nocardioides sp. TF02-7]UMG91591.1 Flp pilus assembly complex ATPase component TadA [Nocardioides sp. TF02-7]
MAVLQPTPTGVGPRRAVLPGPEDVAGALDEVLREAVRRAGIDPQREVAAVRRLAEGVVREHDERSLTGAVPSVADVDGLVAELVARVSGFGPLQPYLDDPTVEEVWINSPDRVFVARNGRHELTNLVLTAAQVTELVERMLKTTGRRVDLSRPFVDAMLPQGHRLHVVLEGISRGFSAVNVRKFVVRAASLAELVDLGSLTPSAALFLEASVRAGLNILVSGGTQAGKTTMLNCLAAAIPGGERVISVEEVFEIRFPHPDWVALQTRQEGLEGTGEIRLRDLVKESLRMRPSRIIVGEVRAEEALDLLLALNSGLPGLCTIHANSAREALTKACTLPLLAGGEHLGAVRRADRRRRRRPGGPPRGRPPRRPAGDGDRGGSRPHRARRDRDRAGLRAARRRAAARDGDAAAHRQLRTGRRRRTPSPPRSRLTWARWSGSAWGWGCSSSGRRSRHRGTGTRGRPGRGGPSGCSPRRAWVRCRRAPSPRCASSPRRPPASSSSRRRRRRRSRWSSACSRATCRWRS